MDAIDNTTNVRKNILMDDLMDEAGTSDSDQRKLIIKEVCGADKSFDSTALNLRRHHARIHMVDKRRRHEHKKSPRRWNTQRHNTCARRP